MTGHTADGARAGSGRTVDAAQAGSGRTGRPQAVPDLTGRPPVGRRERTTGLLAVIGWVLLLVTWAVSAPPLTPAGEQATVDAALRAAHGEPWTPSAPQSVALGQARASIGITPASQRPTVSGLVTALPGDGDGRARAGTTPVVSEVLGTIVRVGGLDDQRWDRAVVLLRLIAVLLLAPLPVLVQAAVRRLTRSPAAGMVGALAVFGVPFLAQAGSSVTVWAPSVLLWAVLAWTGVRWITGDRRVVTALGVGVTAGLLPLVDLGGLVALPVAAVLLLARGAGAGAVGRAAGRRPRVWAAVVGVAIALVGALGSLPWVVATIADRTAAAALPTAEAPSPPLSNDVWSVVVRTSWGPVGPGAVGLPVVFTDIATVLGAIVLVLAVVRRAGAGAGTVAGVRAGAVAVWIAVAGALLLFLACRGTGVPSDLLPGAAVTGLLPLVVAVVAAVLARTVPHRRLVARIVVVAAPVTTFGAYGAVLRDAFVGAALDPRPGIAALAAAAPYGVRAVALCGVLALVVIAAAVVAAWPRARRTDAAAHPGDPAPNRDPRSR